MTVSTRIFASVGSLVLAIGCGSASSTGNDSAPQQRVDPASEPGCTAAPACRDCTVCYQACVCQTGETALCIDKCAGKGATNMPAGTGGASQVGAGGMSPFGTGGAGGITGQSGAGGTVGAGGVAAGGAGGAVTPPATTEYTFQTTPFDVQPGEELYRSQDFQNPFGKDIAIIESESFMTPGSHHMFAFHDPSTSPILGTPIANANGPIQTSTGVEFHPYIHSAQTPQQLVTYPAGVARLYPGGEGLRIQMHYINTGAAVIHAQVSLRVKYVDPSQVPMLAGEVFLNQALLTVPPGQSTQAKSYAMPLDIKLIGAASHMHMHAVNFTSQTSDGRQIYTSTQWNEPVGAAYDPPILISKGTSIKWACSYTNTGGTLTFGEHAQTNEMCIFTGIYYPAPGGIGISTQCLNGGSVCQ